MKELKLIDRVVVEIKGDEGAECMASCIANHLRIVAEQIENGMKGDNYVLERPSNGQKMEVLWERECPNYGGFHMGNRSLICDAYYGAKEYFEVCSVHKDDIEQLGFDSSKLSEEDMLRIASRQGDLMTDCCDYWTALEGACEYWEIPRKDDDVPEVIPGTEGMLNELSIRE